MGKVRVPLHAKPQGFATIEDGATKGATVGVNLLWEDGSLVTAAQLRAAAVPPADGGYPVTYWRLVQEIPKRVSALADVAGFGIYVVSGEGEGATRTLQVAVGELTVARGSGVDGNPLLGLADVEDAGGGSLVRTLFDEKGRRIGTSPATTDDLEEGDNLYFTSERAKAAARQVPVGDFANDVGYLTAADLPPSPGAANRASVTFTGAATVAVGSTAMLLAIESTAPARIRLYCSAAARTADAARAAGVAPPQGAGLLLEFVAVAGLLGAPLTPGILAYTLDSPPSGLIYANVQPDGASADVTVLYLKLEA